MLFTLLLTLLFTLSATCYYLIPWDAIIRYSCIRTYLPFDRPYSMILASNTASVSLSLTVCLTVTVYCLTSRMRLRLSLEPNEVALCLAISMAPSFLPSDLPSDRLHTVCYCMHISCLLPLNQSPAPTSPRLTSLSHRAHSRTINPAVLSPIASLPHGPHGPIIPPYPLEGTQLLLALYSSAVRTKSQG